MLVTSLGLNKKYGGSNANKPKTAKVQTAMGGGFVLPSIPSGGMVGGEQRDKETTPQSLGLPKDDYDEGEETPNAAYDAKHDGEEEKNQSKNRWQHHHESLVPSGDLNPGDTAGSRFNDLMKSTDPQKIADYDSKHGKDAYATKLKQKLGDIYSTDKAVEPQSKMIPTGKVVGREIIWTSYSKSSWTDGRWWCHQEVKLKQAKSRSIGRMAWV